MVISGGKREGKSMKEQEEKVCPLSLSASWREENDRKLSYLLPCTNQRNHNCILFYFCSLPSKRFTLCSLTRKEWYFHNINIPKY